MQIDANASRKDYPAPLLADLALYKYSNTIKTSFVVFPMIFRGADGRAKGALGLAVCVSLFQSFLGKLPSFLGLTPPSYGVSLFQSFLGKLPSFLGLTPPSYGVSLFQSFLHVFGVGASRNS
ncbi:MAG TPA: hypothetical protein PL188_10870 [Candidatus Cloacimonadota bacterium]|nr:hypothetical protein [Candidatus Cloacimonadota bacterium]